MATPEQLTFLKKAYDAACAAQHVFPGAAAAEAALESAWGTSGLCTRANNLFGLKKPTGWTGNTISIPTKEFLHNAWVTVPAEWPVFATWADCMTERMNVLHWVYLYRNALDATTPEQYIADVSVHWSTAPDRATEVLSIYHAHLDILNPMKVAA